MLFKAKSTAPQCNATNQYQRHFKKKKGVHQSFKLYKAGHQKDVRRLQDHAEFYFRLTKTRPQNFPRFVSAFVRLIFANLGEINFRLKGILQNKRDVNSTGLVYVLKHYDGVSESQVKTLESGKH